MTIQAATAENGSVAEVSQYKRSAAALSHAGAHNALLGIGEPSFQQTLSRLQSGTGVNPSAEGPEPVILSPPSGNGFFRAFAGAAAPAVAQPLNLASNSAVSPLSPTSAV